MFHSFVNAEVEKVGKRKRTSENNAASDKKQKVKSSAPSLIDSLVIETELNRGSFGTVYKASYEDTLTGVKREVAVKFIPTNAASNQKQAQALQHEIQMLNAVDGGPYILKYFGMGVDNAGCILVTELCAGGDLQPIAGRINETSIQKIVRQLLEAVDFCHRKNIVHCDIKPENVMLVEKWSSRAPVPDIRLIDFGLAQSLTGKQKLVSRRGTPGYMAPEVWNGRYGKKADMWSIGVFVYAMISGKLPPLCLPPNWYRQTCTFRQRWMDGGLKTIWNGYVNPTIPQRTTKKPKCNYKEQIALQKKWVTTVDQELENKNTSPQCRELVRHLLRINARTRFSASEAFNSPWFTVNVSTTTPTISPTHFLARQNAFDFDLTVHMGQYISYRGPTPSEALHSA